MHLPSSTRSYYLETRSFGFTKSSQVCVSSNSLCVVLFIGSFLFFIFSLFFLSLYLGSRVSENKAHPGYDRLRSLAENMKKIHSDGNLFKLNFCQAIARACGFVVKFVKEVVEVAKCSKLKWLQQGSQGCVKDVSFLPISFWSPLKSTKDCPCFYDQCNMSNFYIINVIVVCEIKNTICYSKLWFPDRNYFWWKFIYLTGT